MAKVIHRNFGDIDELAAFIPEAVRLTQLTCQPFHCRSIALCCETIRFHFNHVNHRLHAIGSKYPGFFTFTCLLIEQKQPVIESNILVTQNHLFGFDPNREANLVFPGNATHCAFYIRPDIFEACAQALDRPDLNAQFFTSNHVYSPESLPALRAYLNQLYDLLKQRSPLLQKPDFQQLILRDFLPLLITALPLQQERLKAPVKAFRRSQMVKQANDYMQAHLDQPLTLSDLCQALDTSSRALCYGFQEVFGISPMAYLKLLRLQGVHRALKAADPGTKTVTGIAAQFGFWHLGYFAHDYHQMFGELPSETLKR
jgi:AraC family ethanolamine operon transcriptional activator